MRKIKPTIAIVLVVLVLFGAAGILASAPRLLQHVESDSVSPANSGLFLLLVASGIAVVSAATVAFSYWHRRRQRH